MRHELFAAALLFAVSACEKNATATPGGVTVSGNAGGTNVSATVPTGSTTTPSSGTPGTTTTPSGTTPSGTTPSGTGTTTPPPEKTGNPAVVQGDAEVKGELDKEKLKTAITAVEPQVLTCYNSALERTPGWTGKVSVRFIVSGKGKVLSADLAEALPDNVLAQCVLTAVKAAKLPKPGNGKDVIFTLPLSLELQ